jgi:hypothetical protein
MDGGMDGQTESRGCRSDHNKKLQVTAASHSHEWGGQQVHNEELGPTGGLLGRQRCIERRTLRFSQERLRPGAVPVTVYDITLSQNVTP